MQHCCERRNSRLVERDRQRAYAIAESLRDGTVQLLKDDKILMCVHTHSHSVESETMKWYQMTSTRGDAVREGKLWHDQLWASIGQMARRSHEDNARSMMTSMAYGCCRDSIAVRTLGVQVHRHNKLHHRYIEHHDVSLVSKVYAIHSHSSDTRVKPSSYAR